MRTGGRHRLVAGELAECPMAVEIRRGQLQHVGIAGRVEGSNRAIPVTREMLASGALDLGGSRNLT